MVKRITIILLIVLGVFISFSLYRTYAYNTTVVEDTPSTTDLEYTFKIGNSSIKEITISSGETKYYDIVMGNPNNAKISYSIYYEMVSPNTKPDGFSIEYTSKSTGDSTGKVDKNGNITLNLVVTNTSSSSVTVKLGSIAGYVNGGELVLSSGQEVIPKKSFPKANIYVESLDDGTTGDSGSGVYKVEHDAIPASSSATGSEIPAVTDYRYYGASPNNYVCLDESNGTCEDRHLYRIIGSIYEELSGQNLLKVIKANPLTDINGKSFSWDYQAIVEEQGAAKGTYNNIWIGSMSMKILNDTWLASESYSYIYAEPDYPPIPDPDEIVIDFTNYGPTDKAQSLISTTSRYYLGGHALTSGVMTNQFYNYERGTIRYDSSRSLYWDGKVGLMYPSDYGYAAGNACVTNTALDNYSGGCMDKDWIYMANDYNWTITSFSSSTSKYVWSVIKGDLKYAGAYLEYDIYPTFYLSKDAVITGGTGTETDPYTISK